jgi:hypothetical protein
MHTRVRCCTSGLFSSLLPSSNRFLYKFPGFLALTLLLAFSPVELPAQASAPPSHGAAAPKHAFQGIPIRFEPNRGQVEKDVKFLAHLHEGDVALTGDGFRLLLPQSGKSEALAAKFVGMDPASEATGEDAGKGVANYYRGSDRAGWIRNLPLFAKVRYSNVYPSTDLVYRASQGRLEYDLELKPGADASRFSLAFSGADTIQLDAGGNLVVGVGERRLRFLAPDSYQMEKGKRVAVRSRYRMLAGSRVGFSVGPYNRTETLVIDPVVAYATFFDLGSDIAQVSLIGMTLDPAGNVYVAFPIPNSTGTAEELLIKADSSGDTVYQNTIQAETTVLTTDASGNLYMAGYAGDNFPTTTTLGSCVSNAGQCGSGVVAKFDPSGNIIYGSFLSSLDNGAVPNAIAVNSAGNVYLTGRGAIQPVNAYQAVGSGSAFFAELNPTGTAYVFASYLGTVPAGDAIALDSTGNVYVAGALHLNGLGSGTVPLFRDFMAVPDSSGLFLSKFSPDGQTLLFSTALEGGSLTGMAVGQDNTVYLVGVAGSSFPWTPGGYRYPQGNGSGGNPMFAMAINPSLTGLTYAEFLGFGYPNAMTLDAKGDLFVAGQEDGDVPPTADALISDSAPPWGGSIAPTGFYLELNPKGQLVTSSEFSGRATSELPTFISVDAQGDIYLAGDMDLLGNEQTPPCQNPDPITVGANASNLESEFIYCNDRLGNGQYPSGFAAEIEPANEPQISLSTVAPYLELRNAGTADLHISAITSSPYPISVSGTCGTTVPAASACMLVLTPGNGSSSEILDSLTIDSDAQPNAQTFNIAPGSGLLYSNPGNLIWLDTSKVVFGAQENLVPSAPRPFTITNFGTVPVAMGAIATAPPYSVTSDCPASLAANASCTGQLVWTPGSFVPGTGVDEGTDVTVNYGPPAQGGQVSFAPRGAMISSPTALLVVPQEIEGPETVGFGSQTIGNGSLYRTIPITNVGTSTMGAPQVTLSGDSTFSIAWNSCTADLAPQQSCAVAILFQPFAALASLGTVTVNGGSDTSEVALLGTGVAGTAVTTISIAPTSTMAGSGEFTLTVTGTGFTSGSKVVWGSTVLATTFVSATELTADVPAPLVSSETTVQVIVGTAGVGVTGTATFTINALAPTITSITPSSIPAGSGSFWLTVNGTNFTGLSAVRWNGTWEELQDFISPTELQVFIGGDQVATQGSANVTVNSPTPGGGTSGAAIFTITAPPPAPTISGIVPTSATAGAAGFPLTVNGTGFTNASTVTWNATPLTTTFMSATQLTAQVNASQVATEGNVSILVTNLVAGGLSNITTFTIDALTPAVSSIAPISVTAGSAAFPLTVNGANFTSQSTVMWGSTALTTMYVSAIQLTAQVPALLVAAQGTASVTVETPAPGGGTSNANTFAINALVPTISGISPASAATGSAAFPLTVNGANFTSASTVMWGTTALTTTFVSATALTAQVTAPLVATEGTASVTVVTPAPGGGTSNAESFSIYVPAPVPSIGGISPAVAIAGGAAFALTVNGANFTNASTVMWGSTALTTQYVSAAEVTAQVTAAEIVSAGVVPVTVQTPAPGGGISNAYSFEIDTAGSTAPAFTTTTVTVTAGTAATYTVTLPSTATNVSVTCLNLPANATCSYAASTGALTVNTTAATPAGTYVITAVFMETLPGAAGSILLLPFLLFPFAGMKKRRRAGMVLAALSGLVIAVALVGGGCGGGGGGSGYTPPTPTTHSVTSSGAVTLVVH